MDLFVSIIYWITGFIIIYFLIIFIFTIFSAKMGRRPIDDYPDWGIIEDHKIPTHRGKKLECWIIYPDKFKDQEKLDPVVLKNNPAVIMTHGWARNRGRMVKRSRYWNSFGYTTILYSVRDHGNSDKEFTGMSIIRFSHDLDSVIKWWGRPVIILGHSIGAGASILVASRNSLVKGLIVEASPLSIPEDFDNIYRPGLKSLTPLLVPGFKLVIPLLFFKYRKKDYSPLHAAGDVKTPTLIMYGDNDEIFPSSHAMEFEKVMKNSKAYVLNGSRHSDLPDHSEYITIIKNFLMKNDFLGKNKEK